MLISTFFCGLSCMAALVSAVPTMHVKRFGSPTQKVSLTPIADTRLARRQDANEPLSLVAAGSQGGAYVGNIVIGSNGVTVPLLFDTGSSEVWVLNPASGYTGAPTFDPSTDASFSGPDGSDSYGYTNGVSISGDYYSGPYSVAGLGANTNVLSVTSEQNFVGGYSGVLGLGLGCGRYPCAINALNLNGFGFYAANGGGSGEWSANAPDTSHTAGDLSWENVITPEGGQGWQFNINDVNVGNTQNYQFQNNVAIVDSGTFGILLEGSAVATILNDLTGSPTSQAVPCSGGPSIYFTFASGTVYELPASVYTLPNGNGGCFIPLYRTSGTQIFGSVFIRAWYTYFDNADALLGFAPSADVF